MYFMRVVWLGEDRHVECRHPDPPDSKFVNPLIGCDYKFSADTSVDDPDTQGRLF